MRMFIIHTLLVCIFFGVGSGWNQPVAYQRNCCTTKGAGIDLIVKIQETIENGFESLTEILLQRLVNITQPAESSTEVPSTTPGTATDTPSTTCESTPTPLLPCQTNSSLPASCSDLPQDSPSGEYLLQNSVYCEMSPEWNETGGWTRVAHLDMRNPEQQCPLGLVLVQAGSKRLCSRSGLYCSSTIFSTQGIQYSRVCGRIIGYQRGGVQPFSGYETIENATLEAAYVEGVSLTYGYLPRNHIWTFANFEDEVSPNFMPFCECEQNKPPFIGNDYFCDTGSRSHRLAGAWYLDDPLWDGQGCRGTNTCCSLNSPPWFCKDLPQLTTEDIEMRVCGSFAHNAITTAVEQVDLYIQ